MDLGCWFANVHAYQVPLWSTGGGWPAAGVSISLCLPLVIARLRQYLLLWPSPGSEPAVGVCSVYMHQIANVTPNTNVDLVCSTIHAWANSKSSLHAQPNVLRTDRGAGVCSHSVIAEGSCYGMVLRIIFDMLADAYVL